MALLTWRPLPASRAALGAAGCRVGWPAASARVTPRSAALRRLFATPDEAAASPRARSEERVVSLEELLSAAPPGNGVFEAGEDEPEEAWERSEQLLRIAASTRRDQPVIKRALPSDAATASVLSAYAPEQGFQELTVTQLAKRLQGGGLLLLDVRSAVEFARSRVAGAVNVPLEELSARARAGELGPQSAPLAVVCASGARSAQACVRLKRVLGFADVSNVRGGLAAWADAGLPLQS